MQIIQIRSSHAKETKMVYAITGEGADEPPVGVFTISKDGFLFVSKPLDREAKASYQMCCVLDENDNRPVFTQNPFFGSVPEAAKIGFEFKTVTATDADDSVNTINAELRYEIIKQHPSLPQKNMFSINPVSGAIRVNADGLDRETYPKYILDVTATDREGSGSSTTGIVLITVTDSNDHAPQFDKTTYTASVSENVAGALVVKMSVTDKDEPQSPAWAANFSIVGGISSEFFSITTGTNKQEGIITAIKELDFEKQNTHIVSVVVVNEVSFDVPLITSTALVTVNVLDVDDPPVFDPEQRIISKPEDLEVNVELTVYTATDPVHMKPLKLTYHVGSDPAGWLNVDKYTGLIRVKSAMDRESPLVKDNKYKALILAISDGDVPTTGTGTLVIELQDVNDNTPTVQNPVVSFCSFSPQPVVLTVKDEEGPQFSAPFQVEIVGDEKVWWDAETINNGKTVQLMQKRKKKKGNSSIMLRIFDSGRHYKDNKISVLENCMTPGTFCVRDPTP